MENVSFSYGKIRYLDNVSLYIEEGRFCRNNRAKWLCKSTLLNLMVGLLKPDSGKYKLFNKPINDFKDLL